MILRTNNKMDEYLSKLGYNFLESEITLPEDLENVINNDFITDNDCVTLKGLTKYGKNNPIYNTDELRFEWEVSQNHFNRWLNEVDRDEMKSMKHLLECGKRLINRLNKQFQNKRFVVSLQFSETSYEGSEVIQFGSIQFRFFQLRPYYDPDYTFNSNDGSRFGVMEIESD